MYKIIQKDYNDYIQHIVVSFSDSGLNNRIKLKIYYYTKENLSLGISGMSFPIIDYKINWGQENPTWLSPSTIKKCNKLAKMKAFL